MKHYIVFGYGGIGSALVQKLAQGNVKVTVVSEKASIALPSTMELIKFNEIKPYIKQYPPDYLINTIGLLHDEQHRPEKKIQQLSKLWLANSISVNVWPAIEIAQALAPILEPNSKLVLMNLSARVSSISDNHLGGWYSYRMSKAALNMLIKTIAIEWSRCAPEAIIVGYHPGTVATQLSAPFRHNVAPEKLFAPNKAVQYLLKVLHNLTLDDSGLLIDWQGKIIPF